MILVLDCCVRGEKSATKKLYERYLELLGSGAEKTVLRLWELPIAPLDGSALEKRDRLLRTGALEDPMFQYAQQFRAAEEIVVAAPYWDLSFPSVLKVYLEQIMVAGVTFGYEKSGCVGYCRARRFLYFSTAGGYLNGENLGAAYCKALAKMLGIPQFLEFTIEGLDVDPARRETLLAEGLDRVAGELQSLLK